LQQIQLQLLLQELSCISYTARALTEDHTRTDTLEHLALGGTVALLELGHDLPHGFSSAYPILFSQSQDDTCPNKRAACAFHIAHARTKSVA
jgi:hypothetical protein